MTVDQAIAGIELSNELPTKWKDLNPDEQEQRKKRWGLDYEEKIAKDRKENPQKWAGVNKEEEAKIIERAVNDSVALIKQINEIKSGLTEGKRKSLIK